MSMNLVAALYETVSPLKNTEWALWFISSDGMACGKLTQSTVDIWKHINFYICKISSSYLLTWDLIQAKVSLFTSILFIEPNIRCFN